MQQADKAALLDKDWLEHMYRLLITQKGFNRERAAEVTLNTLKKHIFLEVTS